MKILSNKRRLSFMSLFLASALVAGIHTSSAKAQDDMLDEADDALSADSLQMDNINIDGKLSASEKIKKMRENLEERNKVMVEKKIENIRVKQEMALTNKLQDAFGKSLNGIQEDKVVVVQAAPIAAPIAPQPVIIPVVETKIIELPLKEEKKSKIIPSFGITSIKSDIINFDSKSNLGVSLETMVMSKLSVGFGIAYTSVDITDTANSFLNNGNQFGSSYYNSFAMGRKMTLGRTSVDINGKFFLTDESRIKPFVGAALSYNRSNLTYQDSGNGYNYNGMNLGTEGYSSTAMGGSVKLGAEIEFTEMLGLNVDFSYTKSLSSGIYNSANTSNYNPDQMRLQNVTKAIQDADITTAQVGLLVKF